MYRIFIEQQHVENNRIHKCNYSNDRYDFKHTLFCMTCDGRDIHSFPIKLQSPKSPRRLPQNQRLYPNC